MIIPRPFIDFYTEKGIIPTRQNIENLEEHFQRRKALYHHLGIPTHLLRDSAIIEFGPGSGHNALFTAHCQPATYVLVDATPASLESSSSQLIEKYGNERIRVVESDILLFDTEEKFDLVLCEGVIPTQKDPSSFLKHVASFARPGGLVVMTCMDSIAVLPEVLRRYLVPLIIRNMEEFSQQVEVLVGFFEKDLKSLDGMSRRFDDWVMDQILHPWSGPLFSIPEAIDALSDDFEIYAASPHFFTDWRWYKKIHGEAFGFNQIAKECYFTQMHNFIDHRFVGLPREVPLNILLRKICDTIYKKVFSQERTERNYPVEELLVDLKGLEKNLEGCHLETLEAISDFRICVEKNEIQALSSFRKFWGRGQQYLSFMRND